MIDKDPSTYSWVAYAWVFALSAWGGVVSFIRKVNAGAARSWNLMELMGELVTSAFAGLITFWLCESAGISPLITACMVGISGHMGSRAIFQFEKWAERKFNGQP
ncbi:MAG: phage holin family protein [Gammaproteobacteria bacterium]|nr:phage holin family protein [Gammaproteobacteria bacterium]MBU1731040.1 phage holin family protein [Gammaproteobacteria bacterium]MBU1893700.1 phage holin family protein [Gammaproteobacteria bacterium]